LSCPKHFFLYLVNHKSKQTFHTIILELVKHTDATESQTNGYQSYATQNGTQAESSGDGGGLLALICGSLCKDTPLAEMFGPPANDNINNNTAQPLSTPVQNGEHFRMRA
jgi:hypothetical protein